MYVSKEVEGVGVMGVGPGVVGMHVDEREHPCEQSVAQEQTDKLLICCWEPDNHHVCSTTWVFVSTSSSVLIEAFEPERNMSKHPPNETTYKIYMEWRISICSEFENLSKTFQIHQRKNRLFSICGRLLHILNAVWLFEKHMFS